MNFLYLISLCIKIELCIRTSDILAPRQDKKFGFPPCFHDHCSWTLFCSLRLIYTSLSSEHHMHSYFPPSLVKIFRRAKRKRKDCLRSIGIWGIRKTQSKFLPLTLEEISSSRLSSMILFPMLLESLSSSSRLTLEPLNYTPLKIDSSYC